MLQKIRLQNYRSYSEFQLDLSENVTLIVGPNAAGKTNLIESIFLLGLGKSFRTEKDSFLMKYNSDIARVKGLIIENKENCIIEILLATGTYAGGRQLKKFTLNQIPKRRVDIVGVLPIVLFSPEELALVGGVGTLS